MIYSRNIWENRAARSLVPGKGAGGDETLSVEWTGSLEACALHQAKVMAPETTRNRTARRSKNRGMTLACEWRHPGWGMNGATTR